ncbi:hypothetical protein L7Q78_38450 [Achromobacter xylosoxidans]|nr:hypothetical protein [Achromobacter xylosoxidans]
MKTHVKTRVKSSVEFFDHQRPIGDAGNISVIAREHHADSMVATRRYIEQFDSPYPFFGRRRTPFQLLMPATKRLPSTVLDDSLLKRTSTWFRLDSLWETCCIRRNDWCRSATASARQTA